MSLFQVTILKSHCTGGGTLSTHKTHKNCQDQFPEYLTCVEYSVQWCLFVKWSRERCKMHLRLENFEIVCEETTRKGARALFLGIFGQRALKLMVLAQHTRIISRIRIRPKNWAKFFLAVKQSRTTKQNRNIPPIRV